MSYGVDISFKLLPYTEMYDFLKLFKKTITQKMPEIAEIDFIYSPIFKDVNIWKELIEGKLEFNNDLVHKLELWFYKTLKYKFFMKDYNGKCLLCVLGIPTPCYDIFDKHIYFQNSCDQDYDRETWEGIEWFENIYDEYMAKDEKETLKLSDREDIEDEELTRIGIDYYKKSLAYDKIWGIFAEDFWNDSDAVYVSMIGYYDYFEQVKFTREIFNSAIRFEAEDKKWAEQHKDYIDKWLKESIKR